MSFLGFPQQNGIHKTISQPFVINSLISSFILLTTEQSLDMGERTARTATWESTKKTVRILLTSEQDRCIDVSCIPIIYASKFVACFPTATLLTASQGSGNQHRQISCEGQLLCVQSNMLRSFLKKEI